MASKNLDISALVNSLGTVKAKLLKSLKLIVIVLVVGMYGFLVFQINRLVGYEPTDDQVQEKLQTVTQPKIDQTAIDKIQQLQDNSTEVKALFQTTRDNPFQE